MLFVHIQKTGGSSLTQLLKEHIPDAQQIGGTHDHALWIRDQFASTWPSLFKFAFVRNPWDRLVSWYMMMQQNLGRSDLRFWLYIRTHASTFEEFILNCPDIIDDVDGRKSLWFNQLDYLSDEKGNLIVDYVGRYEHFENDVQHVLNKLQLSNVVVPYTNKSNHYHYSVYYSEKTRNIVSERYARDIEFWGYRFETF